MQDTLGLFEELKRIVRLAPIDPGIRKLLKHYLEDFATARDALEWKEFNPEDKGTWPKEKGSGLIYQLLSNKGRLFHAWWPPEGNKWMGEHSHRQFYDLWEGEYITHYRGPITPPVENAKGGTARKG